MRRPGSRGGRLLNALFAVAAGLFLVIVVLALRGDYDVYGPQVIGGLNPRPPEWSRPCWRRKPGTESKPFTVRCAKVRGTVVWREGVDPDGDGDRHVVLLAGHRLVTVKYPRTASVRLGGIGSTVQAVGAQPGGGRLLPQVLVVTEDRGT